MITILALDPGNVTGFCEFCMDFESGTGTYHTDNLTSLTDVWHKLQRYQPQYLERNTQLVIHNESFHLYPHRAAAKIGSSFFEIVVIGVIKLFVALGDIQHFERPASMVKNYEVPAEFNMKKTTPHEKDALKHALVCARTCLNVQYSRLKYTHLP